MPDGKLVKYNNNIYYNANDTLNSLISENDIHGKTLTHVVKTGSTTWKDNIVQSSADVIIPLINFTDLKILPFFYNIKITSVSGTITGYCNSSSSAQRSVYAYVYGGINSYYEISVATLDSSSSIHHINNTDTHEEVVLCSIHSSPSFGRYNNSDFFATRDSNSVKAYTTAQQYLSIKIRNATIWWTIDTDVTFNYSIDIYGINLA